MELATRFGAPTTSPQACAGVLRALAARFAVPLLPVPALQLAAACVAAEVWCAFHRAETVTTPVQYGSAATTALAAAVRLAATGVAPPPHVSTGVPAALDVLAPTLAECHVWVDTWFAPDDAQCAHVARLAAACIGAGTDVRHQAVADVLLLAVDEWSEHDGA